MFKKMNIPELHSFEILIFLGRHYRESFYVREIANTLSVSTGSASGHLRALLEMDLVTSERRGRTLLYRANISHPVVREVKILSTLLELSPFLRALKATVSRVLLFGSCAEGEDTFESDIDLLIVTANRAMVLPILSDYEDDISRKLSPIIISKEEVAQLRLTDSPLYERIARGKILIGEGI